MATVGIIDADLLAGRQKRFPNLAAMKLSFYHKNRGDTVSLLPSYRYLSEVEKAYVCCVFTDTAKAVPKWAVELPHVTHGGTGFFFDRAPPLPAGIEHTTPDYSLYKSWAFDKEDKAANLYYTNASIGFLTRGCFRRCQFCINRNKKKAIAASPIEEFHDPNKSIVCLLDDNVLACKDKVGILENLLAACERCKTPFEFKQGIDIRLFTPEVAAAFDTPLHYKEIIFAFDKMEDAKQIRRGFSVMRKRMPRKGAKAYVLCGFSGQGWEDIASAFRRIEVLWEYRCLGYVMRHENCLQAMPQCRNLYTYLAMWANQPQFQRAQTFREYCEVTFPKSNSWGSLRALKSFEKLYPEVARRFFDISYRKTPKAF